MVSGIRAILSNRRGHQRAPTSFRAKLMFAAGNQDGLVVDLSLNGCRVRSSTVLSPGTLVLMSMEIPELSLSIRIDGAVVRWSGVGQYGIQFLHSRTLEQQQLATILNHLPAM
jgi:hypothetical protein